MMPRFITIISFLLLFSFTAKAQNLENSFESWFVLTTTIDSEKVCYIASTPIEQNGNFEQRDEPYILVSLFPNRKPEVSISAGYKYKGGSAVKAEIANQKFQLGKIKEHLAWAETTDEDMEIISAMKLGAKLKAHSDSNSNQYAIDTYSLKGFTAAYDNMIKICSTPPAAASNPTAK